MNWITRFAVLTLFFLPPAFADRAVEIVGGDISIADNVRVDFSVGVNRTTDTMNSIHDELIERVSHVGNSIFHDRDFGFVSQSGLSFTGIGITRGIFDGGHFGFRGHGGTTSTGSSWSSGSSGTTSASTPEPSDAILLLLGLLAFMALKSRSSDRLAV
jgi:hypothetical protein